MTQASVSQENVQASAPPQPELGPTEKAKRDWVFNIVGNPAAPENVATKFEKLRSGSRKKQEHLEALEKELAGRREQMRADFDVVIVDANKNLLGKLIANLRGRDRVRMLDPGRDERKQFNVGGKATPDLLRNANIEGGAPQAEGRPGSEKETESAFAKKTRKEGELLNRMGKHVEFLVDQTSVMRDKGFSDDEIFQQLWEPLRRAGILPGDVILPEFSAVMRQFDGSSDLLEQELSTVKPARQGADAFELVDAGLNAGAAILISGGKVAAAAVGAADAGRPAEIAVQVLSVAVKAATHLKTGTVTIVSKSEIYSGLGDYNKALREVLAAAAGEEIAGMVTALTGKAIMAAGIGEAYAKGDVAMLMGVFGAELSASIATLDTEETNGAYAALGLAIKKSMIAGGAAVEKAFDAPMPTMESLRKDAPKITASAMGTALEVAIAAIPNVVAAASGGNVAMIGKEMAATNQSVEDLVKNSLEAAKKSKPLSPPSEEALQGALASVNAKAQKQFAEELDAAMRATDPVLESLVFGVSPDGDTPEDRAMVLLRQNHDIEQLIAKVNRNMAIYDAARGIVSGSASLVSLTVPYAGMVASAAGFTLALIEAGRLTYHLCKWLDAVEDAEASGSAVVHAIRNRYDLQSRQTLKSYGDVCFKAAELVGNGIALVPKEEAQIAGRITVAVAQAGSEVTSQLTKFYEKYKSKESWRGYRKALANPDDRHQVMQALEENAVLAKYAVAYAALEENDPIARMALKRCGLDEKTLANEDTDAKHVVAYLNALYRQDPQELSRLPLDDDWHPGQIALTAESFAKFYRAGQDEAKLAPFAEYKTALAQIFEFQHAMDDLMAVKSAEKKRIAARVTNDLIHTLMNISPKRSDKPEQLCISFKSYINIMTGMARVERSRIEKIKLAGQPG